MEWYNGTIPAAIQLAKANKVLFVVYISGKDKISKEMDQSWDSSVVVSSSKSTGIVAIKVDAESDTCAQFSAIFPVVTVPATYFIGVNGVPIEVVAGSKTDVELSEIVEKADKSHRDMMNPVSSQLTPDSPGAAGTVLPDVSLNGATASSGSPPAALAAQPDESVEKKAQQARERMDEIRRIKAQKEKEERIEKEKQRRDVGKNMSKLKEMKEEKEAKEIQEQIKKDKEEERKAKERIKEQIARDRAERHRKYQEEKSQREKEKEVERIAKLKAEQEAKARLTAQRSANACLQFRMADGSFVTQQFSATDPLSSAEQFISNHLNKEPGTFRLCMAYPRREFMGNDMSQSMADLGLAPSAAIMVLPPPRGRSVATSSGNQGLISMLLAPLFALWNFIYSFFFARGASSNSSSSASQQSSESQPAGQSNPRKRPATSRREGNIHRLARDDDDEMNTWNGNSTQQM